MVTMLSAISWWVMMMVIAVVLMLLLLLMMMMIAKLSTSGKHNLMVGGAMPGGEQGGSQVDWQEQ